GDLTAPSLGQDHRRRHERTGARTAARLVNARDRRQAGPAQRALVGVDTGVAPYDHPPGSAHAQTSWSLGDVIVTASAGRSRLRSAVLIASHLIASAPRGPRRPARTHRALHRTLARGGRYRVPSSA